MIDRSEGIVFNLYSAHMDVAHAIFTIVKTGHMKAISYIMELSR